MLTFFKFNKHQPREFGYKPRFFDSEKEALEKRLHNSKNYEAAATKGRIREALRHNREVIRRQHRGLWNGSTMRMLIILVVLIIIAFIALNYWMPGLMNFWFPNTEF